MARRHNAFVDFVAYVPVRITYALLAVLPERLVYATLAAMGRGFFRLSGRRKRIALANLELAIGDRRATFERERIGRVATGNMFRVLADIARMPALARGDRFRERLDLTELEAALAEAERLAPGKGIVFCAPHFGSWEAAAGAVAQLCPASNVIVKVPRNRFVERLLTASRASVGMRIHPRRGGIRSVAKALLDGESALFAADQNQRLRGVFVPFFGKLAATERAPVRLALGGGYPIVVGGAIRLGPGLRFRLRIVDVFVPGHGDGNTREERVYNGILRMNRGFETLILEQPEQYFWVHNRFRTRPPEEKQNA